MQEIMAEFELRYQKKWDAIIADSTNLENVIIEIEERMKVPNSVLAQYLKISRNKVDRIMKKT